MPIPGGLSQIGGGPIPVFARRQRADGRRLGRDLRFCRGVPDAERATIAHPGQSVIPCWKSAGALVLLNLVLQWAMALPGRAHLGGALVGIAFVALVPPRRA
ncbi:MAG: hypothetical protein R3D61_06620 [Defluviimonas denitrificans]